MVMRKQPRPPPRSPNQHQVIKDMGFHRQPGGLPEAAILKGAAIAHWARDPAEMNTSVVPKVDFKVGERS